jgi:hypothetical protein
MANPLPNASPSEVIGDFDNDIRAEIGPSTYLAYYGPAFLASSKLPVRVSIRDDRVIGWFPSSLPGGVPQPGPELLFQGTNWVRYEYRMSGARGVGGEVPGIGGFGPSNSPVIFHLTKANAQRVGAAYQAWKSRATVDALAPLIEVANPAVDELEANHKFAPLVMTNGKVSKLRPFVPDRLRFDATGITGWLAAPDQPPGVLVAVTIPIASWTDVRTHLNIPGPFSVLTTLPPPFGSVHAEGLRVAKAGWPPRGFVLTGQNGRIAQMRQAQFKGLLKPFALG